MQKKDKFLANGVGVTLGYELEFVTDQECPECEGRGIVIIDSRCDCCNGTGEVEAVVVVACEDCPYELFCGDGNCNCNLNGCPEATLNETCRICDGVGETTQEEECHECYGSGEIEVNWNIIPCNLGELAFDESPKKYKDTDGTLEFRSRVLSPNFSYRKNVYEVIDIINNDTAAPESCGDRITGLHVHAGVEGDEWELAHLHRIARAWYNWAEDVFLDEFNPDYERYEYCKSWKNWEEWGANINISGYDIQKLGTNERYSSLNFHSYGRHRTIEFRLFDGTLEPEEILKALKWVLAFIKATFIEDDCQIEFEKELRLLL